MQTLMAFDTSYLYFRAFYGVPDSMRDPAGNPVNAVRGLLDSISRLVEQYRPDSIACAWDDDWRPAWRTELLPSYKAHRVVSQEAEGEEIEETPDELSVQVPVIRQALADFGIAVLGAANHEADDVLGSLATQHDGRSLIVTGDRDLFQLVDADTQVIYVGQGVAKHNLVDEDWLVSKYQISGERYVDFAVLRGDPSDGLPGVKGIGEKTAAKIVSQFDSLPQAVEAAKSGQADLPAAACRNLVAAEDYIQRAIPVVRVARELELAATTALPHQTPPIVLSHYSEQLGGSARRLADALNLAS